MNIHHRLRTIAIACFVLCGVRVSTFHAIGAPADLDAAFGGTGKVTTAIGSGDDYGYSIAVQNNGKIVVAGYSKNGSDDEVALARYNADGSLDTAVNGTGKVTTSIGSVGIQGTGVVVQSDGKIVVSAISHNGTDNDFVLLRYSANGILDTSFSGDGIVITNVGDDIAFSVALQSDGKILVTGGSLNNFALIRYNSDGSLDTTFNGTGIVNTPIGPANDTGWKVAVQSDLKIVVAGESFNGSNTDFAVVRYNTNGSLDTTFNGTGKVTTFIGTGDDVGYGLALQSDGKIVVSGSSFNGTDRDFAVVRYNANGSLDTTFNGTGKVTTPVGSGDDWGLRMVLQSNGKIVVTGDSFTGSNKDIAVVRLNANGSLDTTFNGTGKVITPIGPGNDTGNSMALQGDGKILVAASAIIGGNADFVVVRYEGDLDTDRDGILDIYETGTGVFASSTDTGTSPINPDSDADGLTDGQEVNTYLSNPNITDSDSDGFGDGFEVSTGFSPTSALSTPDTLSSILTAVEYRFNAALGISYRVEASTDLLIWTTLETPVIGNGGVITRFYSIEGQPRRFFRSRRN